MKFLFTSNPLHGHFMPMVPLIRAAAAAGHEVRVATGSDLTGLVRHHGFPLWLVGSTFSEAMASMPPAIFDRPPSDLERMRAGALTLFGRPGVARARQLIPMATEWRPDIVVHELFEIAGIEAAAASGALDVVHGFGTQETYLPELASMVCAAAAAELGTPDRTRRLFSSLYLNPYPCGLEPPCHSPFSDVWSIRPEVGIVYPGERLPDRIRDLPYAHTIYLTLGTAFNAPAAWRVALEGVRDLPVNVIATVGPDVDPAIFGPQPAHVALERYLPQALVLPWVDAVVSHGGSGTTLGALAEGKPMVVLPMAADQFINADQVVRTGSGLALPPVARTPERIREAIEQVLTYPSYAAAARVLQSEIRAMPPAEMVLANLVDRVSDLAA